MTSAVSLRWIRRLSLEEVRGALANRGLSVKGILPTLRSRLLRYEAAQLAGKQHILTPEISDATDEGESDEENGAVGEEPIPGPSGVASGPPKSQGSKSRVRIHPPTPPGEFLGPRPAPAADFPRGNSRFAMDAYNIMRKWNLNFSGAQDGEAEAFLIRIEQGR